MWKDANRPTYLTMLDQERKSRLAEARRPHSMNPGSPLSRKLKRLCRQ